MHLNEWEIGMEKDIQWEWGKIYNAKTIQNNQLKMKSLMLKINGEIYHVFNMCLFLVICIYSFDALSIIGNSSKMDFPIFLIIYALSFLAHPQFEK